MRDALFVLRDQDQLLIERITADRNHQPAAWRQRLEASAAAGVTEVVFQPAGPDIGRELEAFMATASG